MINIIIIYVIGCVITATFIQLNYNYFELYEKLNGMNSMLGIFIGLDNEEISNEFGLCTVFMWPILFIFGWILVPMFLVIVTTPYSIISYFIERKSK